MSFTILIVDDEEHFRKNIFDLLTPMGYEVFDVGTLHEARDYIQKGLADIILLDNLLEDGTGINLLEEISKYPIPPAVIMITAFGDIPTAVRATKIGAIDFLEKPVDINKLETSIEIACDRVRMQREIHRYRREEQKKLNFVVGRTEKMQQIVEIAQRAAETSVSVLIMGEHGTGKELLARAIHQMGPRAKKPFIDLSCPTLQETLFESEIFGHEPGTFTDAKTRQIGLMEQADQGIFFLDEVASMPLSIQPKFLRALEERSFRRKGGDKLIHVDVQVISASNQNLKQLIQEGLFREDLYYRLEVIKLTLPPLRERKVDIPELAGLFTRQISQKMGKNVTQVTDRALQAMVKYDWPGNIRQLRNVIERAMVFCDDPAIDLKHLPPEFLDL